MQRLRSRPGIVRRRPDFDAVGNPKWKFLLLRFGRLIGANNALNQYMAHNV